MFIKSECLTNNRCTLHEYFLITMEPLNCRIDGTIHEAFISFQISRRVFPGPSASTDSLIKSFPLTSNDTLTIFRHVRAHHDGGKQFLRRMQKYSAGRKVMEPKPRIYF